MDPGAEKAALDAIAADSWYGKGANAWMVAYSARVWSRYWRGGSCLEMGPAEGIMSDHLVTEFDDVTMVDASTQFCDDLRARHPSATVVCSLFEEFTPERTFDAVVLGHVLEHVTDPIALLAKARAWLSPDGRMYCAVPNARSLHRQAGVLLGLLSEEHELNDADRHHGHRRVYDPESFRGEFVKAGLTIDVFGGYWLKPLANDQIEQWSPELVDAFFQLGERYPDIAAEIYVIAH
jgi:2-polyprenyl-3-methyl-5-hydroxy-6-metoxy-1,4-benzoquinol methylase